MDELTKEWEIKVGEQIRRLRLFKNIDQRVLAAEAGVALNAVKRLEAGLGSTLTSLIKVLGALDVAEWLETLNPEPVDQFFVRQRVSHPRKKPPEGEGEK